MSSGGAASGLCPQGLEGGRRRCVDGSLQKPNKSERWEHQMLDGKAEEDPTLFIFPRPMFSLFLPPPGFLLLELHGGTYLGISAGGEARLTQLRGADRWRIGQSGPGQGCKTDQGGWVRGEGWG